MLRKSGEPLLHGLAGHRKPVTVIEDNAVPLENLYRFVAGLKQIIAKHEVDTGLANGGKQMLERIVKMLLAMRGYLDASDPE